MTDSEQDRRFSEASDLHKALESLCNVDQSQRQIFAHDRLMSAIELVCKPSDEGRRAFTKEQVDILKEISFRIFYILDPLNKPKRGFINALRREFSEKSPFQKIAAVAGVLVFLVTSSYGIVTTSVDVYQKYGQPPKAASATEKLDPTKTTPAPLIPQLPGLLGKP
ncbi:hypothetical protein HUN39_15585 [Methylocystis sp. FS]|uniref:hypothetical protein n=1 Tax=Methylocystis silviterrae TaxID=2743612 RepID=UPI001582501D|nr:hypothetical protein [Methylocystis silviterrae]NUJ81420.1 hypothetical protein [Methylocystis silviterrae]